MILKIIYIRTELCNYKYINAFLAVIRYAHGLVRLQDTKYKIIIVPWMVSL